MKNYMNKKMTKNHWAFTYVELIIAVLIFLFVSLGFRFIMMFLSKSVESEGNILMAKGLLQNSLEEIRGTAQIYFDDIENCQFPGKNNIPADSCGFKALPQSLNHFSRELSVVKEKKSDDLKKVTVTVFWSGLGRLKKIRGSILLVRPKVRSPGNVKGVIRDKQTGDLISDALVVLSPWGDGFEDKLFQITSRKKLGESGYNFDFREGQKGALIVPVGKWRLLVMHASYKDYQHPEPLFILSSQEAELKIGLEKKETKAHLEVRLIDMATKEPCDLPKVKGGGVEIHIYENEQLVAKEVDKASLIYDVSFDQMKKRCFTIKTKAAYRSGFVGKNPCLRDQRVFDPDGISTEFMDANGKWDCHSNNNDSEHIDQFCVTPGEFLRRNLSLVATPLRIVTGRVVDTEAKPIANADVYAFFYDRQWIKSAVTDDKGLFRLAIADNRVLWSISEKWKKKSYLWAEADVEVTGGCRSNMKKRSYSAPMPMLKDFNLHEDMRVGDLIVKPEDIRFGGLKGMVTDARFGYPIDQVEVECSDEIAHSQKGQFQFSCSEGGFALAEGKHHLMINHNRKLEYYPYLTQGNQWYSPADKVLIKSGVFVDKNVRLWPISYGQIKGIVQDARGRALDGAIVKLIDGYGQEQKYLTGKDGVFAFHKIIETWPSSYLKKNDKYFNYDPVHHFIIVEDSRGRYSSFKKEIDYLDDKKELYLSVFLKGAGSM